MISSARPFWFTATIACSGHSGSRLPSSSAFEARRRRVPRDAPPASVTLIKKTGEKILLKAADVRARLGLRSHPRFKLGVLRVGRPRTATSRGGRAVVVSGTRARCPGAAPPEACRQWHLGFRPSSGRNTWTFCSLSTARPKTTATGCLRLLTDRQARRLTMTRPRCNCEKTDCAGPRARLRGCWLQPGRDLPALTCPVRRRDRTDRRSTSSSGRLAAHGARRSARGRRRASHRAPRARVRSAPWSAAGTIPTAKRAACAVPVPARLSTTAATRAAARDDHFACPRGDGDRQRRARPGRRR